MYGTGKEIDLTSIVPYRLLHTRRHAFLEGIRLMGVQLTQRDWSFHIPGQREHILAVQLRNVVSVQGNVQHPFQVTSSPGDIYILPQGEPAAYHYTGTPDMFVLFLSPWMLANVARQSLDRAPDNVELVVRNGTPDPLLLALAQAFLNELQSGGIAGQVYLETLTQTLAVHLLRQHTTRASQPLPSVNNHSHVRLRQVLDFIDAHLHQNISLTDIAAEIHLSPYYLTRLFKHAMGVSLHQYIITRRVERGRQLLESGRYTIGEVAGLIGFADHSHFTQHFKRRYGVPPSTMVKERKTGVKLDG